MSRRETQQDERQFGWFRPRKSRATLYEDVTIDTQPSVHRHLSRGWPVRFEDSRGTWPEDSTALRSSDWYDFRDPGELWERPFYERGAAAEREIEDAVRVARAEGLLDDFAPDWVRFLREQMQVQAFVEHGLWFPLAAAARDCPSDSIAHCVCLQAAMKQRSAQAIVLLGMDLESHHGDVSVDAARERFLTDATWQPARDYLERLAAVRDWGELLVAANLCFEPLVGTFLRRELSLRAAVANGDSVTPVLARAASREWAWTRDWSVELIRFVTGDAAHGARNAELVAGWVGRWLPDALAATETLVPLAEDLEGDVASDGLERTRRSAMELLEQAGLGELAGATR